MQTKTASRPLTHLDAAGSDYPHAWKSINVFQKSRGKDLPDWPKWCFLPMSAWYAIVSKGGDMPFGRIGDVARLSALGAWRYTKGIYRIDPDMLAALKETVISGPIPSDVLLRLPEWSIYVETPGWRWFDIPMFGFFVHLEWDVRTERNELRFLLDTADGLRIQILHIGPWTVSEAVSKAMSEAKRNSSLLKIISDIADTLVTQTLAEQIQPMLAIVMYLCSDEPDIDDDRLPGSSPKIPTPTKTKHGFRLFPADKPHFWTVGTNLGQQLRNTISNVELSENGRKGPKPHLRRAHWHGVWTGPREGERKFKYNWLPPTVVAGVL